MSSDLYLRKFEDLLEIERKAASYYKYYIDRVEDKLLLEKLNELYSDEVKHIDIAKKITDCFRR